MPRSRESGGTLAICRWQEVSKRNGFLRFKYTDKLSRWNGATDIHVPAKKRIVQFHIDPAIDHFTAANTLWDKIDEAFDDINSDL